MRKVYLLVLLSCLSFAGYAASYINVAGTALNVAANWTNDGTPGGTQAANFTTMGDVFLLQNAPAATSLTNTWTLTDVTLTITRTVTFNGGRAILLSGTTTATSNSALTFSAAGNTLTVGDGTNAASLTMLSGANLSFSGGTATLSVAANATLDMGSGNFTAYSPGTITCNGTIKTQNTSATPFIAAKIFSGTGTIEYNGTGAQTVVNETYTCGLLISGNRGAASVTFTSGATTTVNTLTLTATNVTYITTGSTIAYTGTHTILSALTYNNLTSSAGTNTADGDLTVNGNLVITAGTLADAGHTINLLGSVTFTGAHTGAGKILMTGSGATLSGAGGTGNVELNNAGGFSLGATTNINGTLTFTAGKLTIAGFTLSFATGGSVASMSATKCIVGGPATAILTASSTGSVGTLFFDQTTPGTTDRLSQLNENGNGGTLTLGSDVHVAGTVTITNAGTAPTLADGGFTVYVSGNLAGTGKHSGSGKILMTGGASTQTISNLAQSGNIELDNLTNGFSLSAGLTVASGTLTFTNGKLSLSTFTLTFGASGLVSGMSAANSFTCSGAGDAITVSNTADIGTIFFDATSNGSTNLLGTLSLTGAGSKVTLGNNLFLATSLALTNATSTLADGGFTISNAGGITGTGTHSGTGKIVMTGASKTIGGVTLGNLEFNCASTTAYSVATASPTINGTLTFTGAGNSLNIGAFTLTLKGTVSGMSSTKCFTSNGTTSNITINQATDIGTLFFDQTTGGTTNKLATLTINGGGKATLGNNLQVLTSVALTSGKLALNDNTLTLTGAATTITGSSASNCLVGSASSNLSITSSASYSVFFDMTTPGTTNNISAFTKAGAGTLTLGTNMSVSGALTISAGILDMSTNQLLDGGSIAPSITTTLATSCTVNPAIPAGKTWGGTVNYAALTGNGHIPAGTYATLTCSNTSNSNIAEGAITVNTALTTSGAGGTLDMGTYQLSGSLATFTNTGTLVTQCTMNPAIPSPFALAGTVNYNNLTGGQTIASETSYTNLTSGNTSGTNTAAGALAVSGTLTTTSSGTMDMSTFAMSGALATITNNGILKTSNTSATPFTTGKTYAGTGTVEYAVTGGGQTVMAGTYTCNLTLDNTSGTNTASATITVNTPGILTTTASGTFDFNAAGIQLAGTGTFANNGTIKTACTSNPAIPSDKTWAGTVNFYTAAGGQSVPIGTYNILTLSNTSGTQTVVGSGAVTMNGALTTTTGGTLAMVLNQLVNGGSMSVTNNGAITTTNTATPGIPAGLDWSGTTGSVTFAATTGNQHIPQGTYKVLACSNTSNTNTAEGALAVTNSITTSAAGGTLDMGTNQLINQGGTIVTFTNTSTLKTQCTLNPAIPSPFALAGTINYNNLTGGQTIANETSYTNLTSGNTSGTNTAAGALTVSGVLTTTASGTMDMSTFAMAGALGTITNNGTLKTSNTSATPFTTGKTYGGTGTVEYALTGGGQTVMAGTYTCNLTLDNTSGTNTASGTITVNTPGTLTTQSSGTFDFAAAANQLAGTGTMANSGILKTACTSNPAIPASKTWGGTVQFYTAAGGQSIPAGTYNNLTLSNTSGAQTAVGVITVSGLLTTTSGGTLAMLLNQLADGGGMTLNHNGTITTTSVANPAIPAGLNWTGTTGTVTFLAAAGSQHIPQGTYKTLTLSNTAGTNLAEGALTVNSAITTSGAGGVLDMQTFAMNGSLATFTNNANGTVKTQCTVNPCLPINFALAGTVNYNAATGGQTIAAETSYTTLTLGNTSGTQTAGGDITVTTLNNTNASSVLDMTAEYVLAGTTFNNTGTIKTSVPFTKSLLPIPAGKSWTGTIIYDAAAGAQRVVSETAYNNIAFSNTSGTNTSFANLNINGTLTTAGGTLDLGAFTIGGTLTGISGGGTIQTQNNSAAPLKVNQAWTQTVEYNRAAGGQTVVTGTYANLINSNTSSTNALGAAVTVNGDLTLNASSNLSTAGAVLTLGGNILGTGTHSSTGSIAMTGTGKSISAATLQNLTLNGSTFTLSGAPTINGVLTLTAGTLDIANLNLLMGTGSSIAGTPSATAMIITSGSGEVRKSYTGGLSGVNFTYPVGNTTNYTPLAVSFTAGTGGGYLGVKVNNVKDPHNANITNYINRYWNANASGLTSPAYTATATYVAGDVVGTETSIKAAAYSGSLPWVKYAVTNNVTHVLSTGSITGSGIEISGISGASASVTSTASSTICNGGTTTIQALTPSGDPVITYTWAPATGLSATTGSSVNASPTTTTAYTVTLTDGNGETATSVTTVSVTPAPTAAPSNNGYICNGGSVTLTANQGGGTTNYTWSGAMLSSSTVANPTATPSADGTYTLTVTDGTANIGCSATYTTAVTVHAAPTAAPTNNGYICNGGTVTLSAHPANGAAAYVWTGSSITGSTTQNPTATPTTTSVYTLTVTDGTSQPGCAPATQYTTSVTVNSTPTASVNNDGYICIGGTVNLTATPAGGANTYSWSGANLTGAATQNPTATPVSSTVYTLTVSDGSSQPGCAPATQYTTAVTVHGTPTATVGNNGYICVGGTVNLSAIPAGGANTYSWTGSNITGAATQNPTATPTSSTVYTLTVSDGTAQSGCAPATQYTTAVTVNAVPTAAPTNNGPICNGGTVTLTAHPANGATAYVWTGSNITGPTAQNPTATPTSTTTYTLVVSDGSSQSGCAPATQYTTAVTVGAQPGVGIMASTVGIICPTIVETLTATPSGGAGTANYTWSGPAIVSPVSSGTAATYTLVPSPAYSMIPTNAAGAYTVTLTFSGLGCNTVTATSSTVTPSLHQWQGGTSTNWHTDANWICGITPIVSDDILIPVGTNQPTILASATANAHKVVVNSSVTLTMNNSSVLNITGDFKNNGSVTGTATSNLELNGSSSQALSGNGNIYNMKLNNSTGAVIGTSGDTVTVKGTLTLTSGTLTTNGRLMLYSGAAGTARIAQITGGAITGNVTIQQYIPGGQRAYRFMGHPFNSYIPLSMLMPYMDITGLDGADNGFTPTYTNAASSYWYDPTVGNQTSTPDPGWTEFTSTNGVATANKFRQYQGARFLIRGAKGQGLDGATYTPSANTIRMYGTLNTGNQNIPMVKGSNVNREFNLVANPYPSPVDIGTVIKSAFDGGQLTNNKFWVWNPYSGSGGAWELLLATGTPYYLAANESFYLRTAANGNVLNFTEAHKSASISEVLMKTTPKEYMILNVYDSNYRRYDAAYFEFNNKATENDEDQFDASKPMNPEGMNFYSLSAENHPLNLDSRPYEAGKSIPLAMHTDCTQEYIIKAQNAVVPAGGKVYLHDKFLKKYTQITEGVEYKFNVTTDPRSQGDNRFELNMDPTIVPEVSTGTDMAISLMPNPATDEVTINYATAGDNKTTLNIIDLKGITVITRELGTDKSGSVIVPVNQLASGIYIVTLTSGTERVVRRLIKE